jgi:hypothetical protein
VNVLGSFLRTEHFVRRHIEMRVDTLVDIHLPACAAVAMW